MRKSARFLSPSSLRWVVWGATVCVLAACAEPLDDEPRERDNEGGGPSDGSGAKSSGGASWWDPDDPFVPAVGGTNGAGATSNTGGSAGMTNTGGSGGSDGSGGSLPVGTSEPEPCDADDYPIPARTDWTASASSVGDPATQAIDGDAGTRWSTGSLQVGIEWFRVDMGTETRISRIVLDTSNSAGDYPREYEAEVSLDGNTWVSVATGDGEAVTTIDFPSHSARFFRVNQTLSGEEIASWWSIHELTVACQD